MDLGLKLRNGNILLSLSEDGEVDIGGGKKLWVPNVHGRAGGCHIGRVIGFSADVRDKDIVPGRLVVITRFTCDKLEWCGEEYYIVKQGNIVGYLSNETGNDTIRAKGSNIFVEVSEETTRKSGLVTFTKLKHGEVIEGKISSVGEDVEGFSEDDEVLFLRDKGVRIEDGARSLMILEDDDIVATKEAS
jgi:co-chaperonin GroES (HSP10)